MYEILPVYLVSKDGMLSVLNALSDCGLNTRKKTLTGSSFQVPLRDSKVTKLRQKGCAVNKIIAAEPLIQKVSKQTMAA